MMQVIANQNYITAVGSSEWVRNDGGGGSRVLIGDGGEAVPEYLHFAGRSVTCGLSRMLGAGYRVIVCEAFPHGTADKQ